MPDEFQTDQPRKHHRLLRMILLLLAVISSPMTCCGLTLLLDALPASLLPPGANFMLNIFETEVLIENKTAETFYITLITTTYGDPRVIGQQSHFRQRDFPLEPNGSIVLSYDAADMPLSGIVVCRNEGDCRLLVSDYSDVYPIYYFEYFPALEPSWLSAVRSHPVYNFNIVLIPSLVLPSILLFSGWLYWSWLDRKQAG